MPVILLRHTRPLIADGICYGRTDLALPESFAEDAARSLESLPCVSQVRTSPLTRCLRLARFVARSRNLPLSVEPDLREMDFGAWEGRAWDDLPRSELDAWAGDFENARPHGGESVAMLADRLTPLVEDAHPRREPPELWVTHSGVVRAAHAILGRRDHWDTKLDFGKWCDLDSDAPL